MVDIRFSGRPVIAEAAVALPSYPPPVLVTVPNVPICATGIEYPLASGPATFTEEDLVSAIQSQDDPAIHSPRLKIGHVDPRFNGPQFDGSPAFGKAVSLRLSADRQVLMSDWVGVPKWLADIMPIAYPNRSIEGNMEVETVTGHKWNLCIWRIALLGIQWPGVSVLEDLPYWYGEEMPPGVRLINPETGEEVEAVKNPITAAPGRTVTAAIAVEDIRRAYYEQLEADQFWWWIRSMYLDPNELIVDDDEGQLYRVPFTVDGEAVSFGDPVEVKIQYVDASNRQSGGERRALALVASAGRQVASYDNRVAAGRPGSQEGSTVDPVIIQSLRAHHGLTAEQLPDDATEDQITAAINAADGGSAEENTGGGNEGGEGQPEGTSDQPGQPAPGEGGGEPNGDVAASALPPGMVAVPQTAWAQVQQQAAAGARVAEQAAVAERDQIIEAAVRDGKIRPSERQSYVNLWSGNEQSARTLLTASVDKGGLMPNLVPMKERGSNPSQAGDVAAADSAYEEAWLSPAERARIGAIKAGTHQPERVLSDVNQGQSH